MRIANTKLIEIINSPEDQAVEGGQTGATPSVPNTIPFTPADPKRERLEDQPFSLHQTPMAAALGHAKAGLPVFPCRPCKDNLIGKKAKSPLIDGGFKNATTNEDTIRSWWRNWANAAIGMPTGEVTGVFVVDLDNKDGRDGKPSLATLEAEHGPLPSTKRVSTPSGGEHLYFEMPEGVNIRCSSDKIGSGIDIRANGGYVIVPPSKLVDQSGSSIGHYEETWDSLGCPAEPPEWLIDLIVERPKPAKAVPHSLQANGASWATTKLDEQCASVSEAKPGARNDALNKAAFVVGQLIGMGVIPRGEGEEALMAAARVCGLGETETHATVASGIEAGVSKSPERPFFIDKNPKGGIDARSLLNVGALLDWSGVSLRWNAFVDRYELNGLMGHLYLTDKSTAGLWGRAHEIGFRVDKGFLRDCLEVAALDLARLKRDRDQLWAEAVDREASGESIELSRELWEDAEREQQARLERDPWVEELSNELVGIEGKLLVADARRIVSRSLDRWGAFENERLGRAMRELGWERRYLRDGEHRYYYYVKGKEPFRKVNVTLENSSQVRVHMDRTDKP